MEISLEAFCTNCNKNHILYYGNSKIEAKKLISKLEKSKRMDFELEESKASQKFSTEYLFGEAKGQMLGIMECISKNNEHIYLKAFSGQYNGKWLIPNWVPPIPDVSKFNKLVNPVDLKIKKLDKLIARNNSDIEIQNLIKRRKELSQELTKKIQNLYTISNFHKDEKIISEFFIKNAPTGSGDCCAPKLLNYAIQNNLKVISIAEFYFGKKNKSGLKEHGKFYTACIDKCLPILGFMMCGMKQNES